MKHIVAGRPDNNSDTVAHVRAGVPGKRIVLGVVAAALIGALVWLNRVWLIDALWLARSARLDLLAAAMVLILLSYLVSSRVFAIALNALGYRIGVVPLWTTALTAIVISQCVPAGGVGSYAFLLRTFCKRGVPAGQAALLAALETLSYAAAMLLIGVFSVAYLSAHAATGDGALVAPLSAGAIAVVATGAAIWLLRRPEPALRRALLRPSRLMPRHRRHAAARLLHHTASELIRARALLRSRPRLVAVLVAVQLTALCGHGLALLLLLRALEAPLAYGAGLSAFGVALISSTFNVLPGGGGTVETAIVAALLQLGVGPVAVPAAILFRLLNFWALLPVAGGYLLLQGKSKQELRIEN